MTNLKSIRSQVLTIANILKSDFGFSEAQQLGWKAIKAKQLLKDNICQVSFTKSNGETRTYLGTLNSAFMPERKKSGKSRKRTSAKISFRTISGEWKSFLPQNLESVIVIDSIQRIVTRSINRGELLPSKMAA